VTHPEGVHPQLTHQKQNKTKQNPQRSARSADCQEVMLFRGHLLVLLPALVLNFSKKEYRKKA